MKQQDILILGGLAVAAWFLMSRSNAGIIHGTGPLPSGSRYMTSTGYPVSTNPNIDPWAALGAGAAGTILNDVSGWITGDGTAQGSGGGTYDPSLDPLQYE